MTTVFPLRNLGPDADPWGRTIQGAVSGLERDLTQAINSNNATDQMQTTQLNSLVQSQKVLQAQQETLSSQQNELVDQQNELVALAATRTSVAFASNFAQLSISGFPDVKATIPFPDWAMSAMVIVTATGGASTSTNPNGLIRGIAYGSSLGGVESAEGGATQSLLSYTQGFTPSGLSQGTYTTTNVVSAVFSKTDSTPAVTGEVKWVNTTPTANANIRVSVCAFFTSAT